VMADATKVAAESESLAEPVDSELQAATMVQVAKRTGKLGRVSRCAVIEGTILQPPRSVPSC